MQLKATNKTQTTSAFGPLGSTASPLALLHYPTWVAKDALTITLQQAVGADEALRAGTYRTAVTFSLSTTTP